MKRGIILLPDDVTAWLKVRADESRRNVSRWLAELPEGMRRRESGYDCAMERYLPRKPRRLHWIDCRKPAREDLHDRAGFR